MWNNAVSFISFDTLPCHGVGCVHGAEGMSLVKAEWGPLNFFNSGKSLKLPVFKLFLWQQKQPKPSTHNTMGKISELTPNIY